MNLELRNAGFPRFQHSGILESRIPDLGNYGIWNYGVQDSEVLEFWIIFVVRFWKSRSWNLGLEVFRFWNCGILESRIPELRNFGISSSTNLELCVSGIFGMLESRIPDFGSKIPDLGNLGFQDSKDFSTAEFSNCGIHKSRMLDLWNLDFRNHGF